MATTTTRLALRKPDPTPATGDFVSASLDLNANWDKVDAGMGAIACTSGARPGAPYNGQLARETDTGNLIIWDGAAWRRIFIETQTPNASGLLAMGRSAATDGILTGRVNGDANSRVFVDAAGAYWTGPGSATQDTRWRRNAANEMTLDDGAGNKGLVVASNTLYKVKTVLGGTTASITFSSIPSTLSRITVFWTARGTNASTSIELRMRVNNISTGTYDTQYTQGNGAAANGGLITAATGAYIGEMAAASATANQFGSGRVDIPGWDSPHSGFLSWVFQGGTTANGGRNITGHGLQPGAGAYNRLDFLPSAGSFAAGTAIYLEGSWS